MFDHNWTPMLVGLGILICVGSLVLLYLYLDRDQDWAGTVGSWVMALGIIFIIVGFIGRNGHRFNQAQIKTLTAQYERVSNTKAQVEGQLSVLKPATKAYDLKLKQLIDLVDQKATLQAKLDRVKYQQIRLRPRDQGVNDAN